MPRPIRAHPPVSTQSGGVQPAGLPVVVNIRKESLKQRGFADFREWAMDPTHVYIGRNMEFYVPGTKGSKWANPFTAKHGSIPTRIKKFEEYLRSHETLLLQLPELATATEIGCWCHPAPCHGDVIVALLGEAHVKGTRRDDITEHVGSFPSVSSQSKQTLGKKRQREEC